MKTKNGIISLLKQLEKEWNDDYLLFDWSGSLTLVESQTGKVINTFNGIRSDGGDPDNLLVDGETYIKHLLP